MFAQSNRVISNKTAKNDSAFVMKKSPWGAVLRSAILPGWGQIYNKSYWKAPVIWTAAGLLVYGWKKFNNEYWKYKNLYSNSLKQSKSGNNGYLEYRNLYRSNRDLFAIYIGIAYFLNLIDAYVDAQLFDFSAVMNRKFNSLQLKINFRF